MTKTVNRDNPLLDKKYCYHGIHGAIFRLPSILEHGILPLCEIKKLDIPENTDSLWSYNGQHNVSVMISPQFCQTGSSKLGQDCKYGYSYSQGIVFVCETDYWRGDEAQKSGIPFEAHTSRILPSQIRGIILPDEFFSKTIKECGSLNIAYGSYNGVCKSFLQYMKEDCGYEVSEGYDVYIRLLRGISHCINMGNKVGNNLRKDIFQDMQQAGLLQNLQEIMGEKIDKENNIKDLDLKFSLKTKYYCINQWVVENLEARIFEDLQKAVDKKLGKANSTFADIVNFYIKDKPHIKLYHKEELEKDVESHPLKLQREREPISGDGFENHRLSLIRMTRTTSR